MLCVVVCCFFLFQAEDGIRDLVRSRGLGDVYKRQALRLRIPAVYLVDSSGLFLPEQSRAFPGMRGAGHIFKMNSLLSAHGVPQIAGVFGDCIAAVSYTHLTLPTSDLV